MVRLKEVTGVKRGEIAYLPVSHLRFFSENVRTDYGFRKQFEDQILELLKSQVHILSGEPSNLSEGELDLILSNLSDPSEVGTQSTMEWLVNSILAEGVQAEIRGIWDSQKEVFTNTDGNRRLAAIIIIYLMGKGDSVVRVPVRVEDQNVSEVDLLLRQFTTNSSRQLSPMEQCRLFIKVQKAGVDIEDIATRTGFTVPTIKNRLALNALPEQIKVHVESGVVTPTVALQVYQEAKEEGISTSELIEAVTEAVNEARENGKNKATKNLIKETTEKKTTRTKKELSPEEIEEKRMQALDLIEHFEFSTLTLDQLEKITKVMGY